MFVFLQIFVYSIAWGGDSSRAAFDTWFDQTFTVCRVDAFAYKSVLTLDVKRKSFVRLMILSIKIYVFLRRFSRVIMFSGSDFGETEIWTSVHHTIILSS